MIWTTFIFYRNGESPLDRTPSPRNRVAYHPHYDTGFFDTISNVVENSKGNRGLRRQRRHYPLARHRRGIWYQINKIPKLLTPNNNSNKKPLGSWSASTSPARSPSPIRYSHSNGHHRKRNRKFGTTSLCQKSRSPSPDQLLELHEIDRLREMGSYIWS